MVSPLILLLSFIIILISVFVLKVSLRDNKLILLLAFYVSYLFIGGSSLLWSDYYLADSTNIVRLFRSYISSTILILAFYLGAKVIMIHRPKRSIYVYIFPFFIFTTLATVFGEPLGLYNSFEYMAHAQRGERSAGFFSNPNEAGSFCNFALVIFLSLFFMFKRKLFFLGLAAFAIAGSGLSFSKAAFFVTAMVLLLFVFKNITSFHRVSLRTRVTFVMLIAVMGFGGLTYLNSSLGKKYQLTYAQQTRIVGAMALLSGKINSKTTSDRTVVFRHGLYLINKSPLVGHGVGTFHKFNTGILHIGVHNTFIMIFGESGILPFAFFMIFLGLLFYKGVMIRDVGLSFLIIGIVSAYILGVAGTSHNALDDRTSNALFAILLAILSYRKQCVE